jgi:hypothetical protein
MLKEFGQVTESHSYISLDGSSLINEGFDVAAGTAVAGTGTVAVAKKKKNKSKGGGGGSSSTSTAASGIYHIQGKEEWEYTVKDKVPHTRKKGSSTWLLLVNPTNVKKIIQKAVNAGKYAYFPLFDRTTLKRLDKNLYVWTAASGYEVYLDGAWERVEEPTLSKLIKLYGSKPFSELSSATTAISETDYTTIDNEFKAIAKMLVDLFDDTSFWYEFKGYVNDDEEGAMVKFKQWWDDEILPLKDKASAKVKKVVDKKIKDKYDRNLATIWKWRYDDSDDTLLDTLEGANDSDYFSFTFYYSKGQKTDTIYCDF